MPRGARGRLLTPRTVAWCLTHLASEGLGFEVHFEHFKTLRGLQHNQWGLEECATLVVIARGRLAHSQVDGRSLVGMELLFRRLQAIE